jgi:hypothetical protein
MKRQTIVLTARLQPFNDSTVQLFIALGFSQTFPLSCARFSFLALSRASPHHAS